MTLILQGRNGLTLSNYTPLDSMLTVVDASSVLAQLQSPDSLAARGMAVDEDDKRTIASLMVQQIECADTCACGYSVRCAPLLLYMP